jgi:hypothetical protein
MVFEHFLDLFDPKDSTNEFLQLFQMNSNVVVNHIPRSIVPTLGVARLLVFAKPFRSIWPIMVGEVY